MKQNFQSAPVQNAWISAAAASSRLGSPMCAQCAEQPLHLDQPRAGINPGFAAQKSPELQHVIRGLAGFPGCLASQRGVAQTVERETGFPPLGDQAFLLVCVRRIHIRQCSAVRGGGLILKRLAVTAFSRFGYSGGAQLRPGSCILVRSAQLAAERDSLVAARTAFNRRHHTRHRNHHHPRCWRRCCYRHQNHRCRHRQSCSKNRRRSK